MTKSALRGLTRTQELQCGELVAAFDSRIRRQRAHILAQLEQVLIVRQQFRLCKGVRVVRYRLGDDAPYIHCLCPTVNDFISTVQRRAVYLLKEKPAC